jgi:hypothetical protein
MTESIACLVAYGLESGLVRRFTHHHEGVLNADPDKEAVACVSVELPFTPHKLQEAVNAITGLAAKFGIDNRHCVVDAQGNIVNVILCDPACGDVAPPGHTLVQHSTADTNWKYENGTLKEAKP